MNPTHPASPTHFQDSAEAQNRKCVQFFRCCNYTTLYGDRASVRISKFAYSALPPLRSYTSPRERKKERRARLVAEVLIITSAAGICASPTCAEVTRRRQQEGGEEKESSDSKGTEEYGQRDVLDWFHVSIW